MTSHQPDPIWTEAVADERLRMLQGIANHVRFEHAGEDAEHLEAELRRRCGLRDLAVDDGEVAEICRGIAAGRWVDVRRVVRSLHRADAGPR
ncbi:hypothetical protein GCM10025868_02030 [Angustibacter aerolatus]|uniref:Uncharacterized protein n=1 Tax=Angustibacter aerolatus TaxID=1162965 RepID=A0ABQ6J9W7_9ACTN|nr:hypothetical protein [Angustibacter aerolatus]GMA84953.1 hypothetical protein GCM10025868_02030 [Angustibacter aerolatus]